MVKGVNKTVIEVNNTGSRIFDRIVFYVTPQYGNLSARQLRKAASQFTFQFDEAVTPYKSLRNRMVHKKRNRIIIISAGVLLLATAVALIMIL